MRSTLFLLFLSALFVSCSTHRGLMIASRCTGDCTFSSIAFGSTDANYFLGIGGNNSDALLFEAKRNMFLAFPLKKGAFYDNLIVDYKNTNYIFYSKLRVTVTADIVTSGKFAEDDVYTENYLNTLKSGKNSTLNHLNLSDSVVFISGGGLKKGVLLSFYKNKADVLITNSHESLEKVLVPINNLYAIDNEEIEDTTGLEANQILEYVSGNNKEATIVKEVAGLKPDKVLLKIIKNGKATYSVVLLEKLKYK